jgi:arylsulfatase
LYDLRRDPGERYNLIAQHPDVVAQLTALAWQARADLGDDLTQTKGANRRAPGQATIKTP